MRFLSDETPTFDVPATSGNTRGGTLGGPISSHLILREGEAEEEAKTGLEGDMSTTRRKSSTAVERDSSAFSDAK